MGIKTLLKTRAVRQAILGAIKTDPKSITEIAQETGIERHKVQNNITAIVNEELAIRETDHGVIVYHITKKGSDRVGNPGKKIPKERPPVSMKVVKTDPVPTKNYPIQRLLRADDKFNEQEAAVSVKQDIRYAPSIQQALDMLMGLMSNGVSVTIFHDGIHLENSDGNCYKADPDDFITVLNAVKMLEERLVA